MDPLSITAAIVGFLDVCTRLIQFLADTRKVSKTVDSDLESIAQDVEAVSRATELLVDVYEIGINQTPQSVKSEKNHLYRVWKNISQIIPRCKRLICKMQRFVEEIEATRAPKHLSSFMKQLKKQVRESEYHDLRRELNSYKITLQMLLSAGETSLLWGTRSSQEELTKEIHREFVQLNSRIEVFQTLLECEWGAELREAFDAARNIASLRSYNKCFDLPQPVSSIFTGREDFLQNLEKTMFSSVMESDTTGSSGVQKRFVVYGLGGSGKTQFCCKWAQDNHQKFWGVFWIDGSAEQRIKQTYAKIAKDAGLEPIDRAAMSWLSSLKEPWLLIIDNADGTIDLDSYLPTGERGHILITTRNPTYQMYGTIGEKFFDFSRWDPRAATSLLLKAANEPLPWTSTVENLAFEITTVLGHLPLALIVAGRTIVKGLCTLGDYLAFYEMSWKRTRRRSRGKSTSEIRVAMKDNPNSGIHGTCEVGLMSLQRGQSQACIDAVELLNAFSFLHREDISVNLLKQAAINPRLEKCRRAASGNSMLPRGACCIGSSPRSISSWQAPILSRIKLTF